MNNLNCRLNNRIDLWGNIPYENELGETDYKPDKIKSLWCEIRPTTGSVKTTLGNVIEVENKYKITVRVNAIKNLTNDMYLMYKGMRFDIDYNIPNFKYKDRIEIYCSLKS